MFPIGALHVDFACAVDGDLTMFSFGVFLLEVFLHVLPTDTSLDFVSLAFFSGHVCVVVSRPACRNFLFAWFVVLLRGRHVCVSFRFGFVRCHVAAAIQSRLPLEPYLLVVPWPERSRLV